jgi:hypothetical protein
MKFVRLATTTVLTASILAGGVTAFADPNPVTKVETDSQITFIADDESELEVIPPVTDPDVIIDPEVPGTTGPLSIIKAATMDFGTQKISNQEQTYNMLTEWAPLADGSGDQVPYVSFAQVQDVRGTNEGWQLLVTLDDFTSSTQNNVLTGAKIKFVTGSIEYLGDASNAPTAHDNNMELEAGGDAQPVMTAADGQGAGASSVVWGDQASLTAQFEDPAFDSDTDVIENEAIQLIVPGSTAKDATTYESTLTWELTATPDENAGG